MIINHEVYLAGISSHEMEMECLRRAITIQQAKIQVTTLTLARMQDRLARQESEYNRQVNSVNSVNSVKTP